MSPKSKRGSPPKKGKPAGRKSGRRKVVKPSRSESVLDSHLLRAFYPQLGAAAPFPAPFGNRSPVVPFVTEDEFIMLTPDATYGNCASYLFPDIINGTPSGTVLNPNWINVAGASFTSTNTWTTAGIATVGSGSYSTIVANYAMTRLVSARLKFLYTGSTLDNQGFVMVKRFSPLTPNGTGGMTSTVPLDANFLTTFKFSGRIDGNFSMTLPAVDRLAQRYRSPYGDDQAENDVPSGFDAYLIFVGGRETSTHSPGKIILTRQWEGIPRQGNATTAFAEIPPILTEKSQQVIEDTQAALLEERKCIASSSVGDSDVSLLRNIEETFNGIARRHGARIIDNAAGLLVQQLHGHAERFMYGAGGHGGGAMAELR